MKYQTDLSFHLFMFRGFVANMVADTFGMPLIASTPAKVKDSRQ